MKRLQVFALAGALTLTVFTGAAAIMGLSHGSTKHGAPSAVVQVASPTAPERWDD
jgi:hypothetical protein